MNIWKMRLKPEPFEQIRIGMKTIELRLLDEKRREIAVDDLIEFTNIQTTDKLTARVIALHLFDTFKSLYESLPLLKCGYTPETLASATHADMDAYYSREEQSLYGVVGIELRLI